MATTPSVADTAFLRAGAGERADLELGVAVLAGGVLAQQGAEDAAEEAERDGDEARVAQREPGEVASGISDVGVPETTGEKITSTDGGDQPAEDAGTSPRRC